MDYLLHRRTIQRYIKENNDQCCPGHYKCCPEQKSKYTECTNESCPDKNLLAAIVFEDGHETLLDTHVHVTKSNIEYPIGAATATTSAAAGLPLTATSGQIPNGNPCSNLPYPRNFKTSNHENNTGNTIVNPTNSFNDLGKGSKVTLLENGKMKVEKHQVLHHEDGLDAAKDASSNITGNINYKIITQNINVKKKKYLPSKQASFGEFE